MTTTSQPSGLHILIVGAGFAGLSAAIECTCKGHRVTLFEKVCSIDEITRYGDIISFDPNGSRVFEKWVYPDKSSVAEKNGGNFSTDGLVGFVSLPGKRGATSVDVGVRVVEYFESDGDEKKGPQAGVMEKVMGDAVLAAEGVRSRGRKLVLGLEEDEQPKSSGYAVYRAWFPSEPVIAKNPVTKHVVENGDQQKGYIGPDIHFLVSSIKGGSEIKWVFTHIDDGNIEESWQFPGKPEEALAYLEGWCPVVRELVKATPPGRLIDYKLVYREPLPTFVSPKGRIALIGDAAHPFLPTSIQGASQSIEDGTVVAAGNMSKEQVMPTALKTYEKLRWHKADWNGPEGVWKVPEKLWLLREEWLLGFDAEGDT
ncbi:uncharacterized protein B0T23DRAFT_410149 [Neurospora hispaniola]|uniref:FAD-dependent oxidoreductase 2 FAD-binding domain-containing protein n=1 Tax=Neurospora hispaniola TaxID=588809 RepID=A0AAJ0IHI5_9PEZI|nr:hypothetical protein B0T23DRAFT_410149 [Neurospora hispaniola]